MLAPLLFLGLAGFGVYKYLEKDRSVANLEAIPPLTHLPELSACLDHLNGRFVIRGTFETAHERFVGVCHSLDCSHSILTHLKDGIFSSGIYHIYTPFRLLDSKKTIYVDRGYLTNPIGSLQKTPTEQPRVIQISGFLVQIPKYKKKAEKMIEKLDYEGYCLRADTSMNFVDTTPQNIGIRSKNYSFIFSVGCFLTSLTLLLMLLKKRLPNHSSKKH